MQEGRRVFLFVRLQPQRGNFSFISFYPREELEIEEAELSQCSWILFLFFKEYYVLAASS